MRRFTWFAVCLSLLSACGTGPALTTLTPTPSPTASAPLATDTPRPSPTETITLTPSITPTPNGGIPAFSHIFLIIMENKEQSSVIGDDDAPYLNGLASQYARADQYFGIMHPSLPNYLALIGGDTFNVATDCTACFNDADNLADQITAAGKTWKGYMEDMPEPCFLDNSRGDYAKRHNPFMYFNRVRRNPDQCGRVVPYSQFATDLEANTLPDFAWITPNLCHDMHDCRVSKGDQWLQEQVPPILASKAWQDGGVLFITFDEGSTFGGCCTHAHGGNIPTLVISPLARPGFVSQVEYDHYSLLRTIEMAWGLPLLGKASCECSPAMADFFATP